MSDAENKVKEMIIDRYGSLQKFCNEIEMPWTTLNSILTRGFLNSNISNVMKITKELQIDTDALANGIVQPVKRKETFSTMNLSSLEISIIERFRTLNDGERSMFLRSLGIDDDESESDRLA